MVSRRIRSHIPRTTQRQRNTNNRKPGLRHDQHEADPIPSKHRLHANHPRQLLRPRPERQPVRQNQLVSASHLSRKHSKWDWGVPPHQHSMPHLHPYRKPVPVPDRKQLHNNTHHTAKQPVLLHHNTIDPRLIPRKEPVYSARHEDCYQEPAIYTMPERILQGSVSPAPGAP